MDLDFLVWLSSLRTPICDAFFSIATYLGSEYVAIGVFCLCYWCLNKRLGNRLMFSVFWGMMVNQFLKAVFCVRRPWMRTDRLTPLESALADANDYSFPSGHSANSISIFGVLASEKRKYFKLFWLVPIIVAFSRLYVGVHTPQDVLTSLILGVCFVYLAEKLEIMLERKPALDLPFTLIGIIVALAAGAYTYFKPYPDEFAVNSSINHLKFTGVAVGFLIGWFAERKLVHFSVSVSPVKKALRFVGGIACLLIAMEGLKPLFIYLMGESVGAFFRYMIVGVCATFVWPFIFTKAGF